MGPRSIRGRIVAGVLIVTPLAVTFLLVRFLYQMILPVGVRLVYVVSKLLFVAFGIGDEPRWIEPANASWSEITVAVVLTVLMLYLLGWLGSNMVGQRVIAMFESLVARIPLVDTFYGAAKQMIKALSGPGAAGSGAQRVVMIDFPTDNMKVIAFMTGTVVDRNTGQVYATAFVPTTPNPTSGYLEFVPIERVTGTDLTMEQALSMILSAGAASPVDMGLSPGARAKTHSPPPPQPVGAAASKAT